MSNYYQATKDMAYWLSHEQEYIDTFSVEEPEEVDENDYDVKLVEDDGGGVHWSDEECEWCGVAGGHICSECGEEISEIECREWEGLCEGCAVQEAL